MGAEIHAVLFDKDGTLFDFDATWGTWCQRVLQRLAPDDLDVQAALGAACGYDAARNGFMAGSTIVNGAAIDTLTAWQTVLPNLQADAVRQIAMFEMDGLPVAPVCALSPLLDQLSKDGYVLGVATNDFEAPAKTQLAQAQITDHFAFVCGSDSGFGSKPEAGMIHGFCDAVGISPENVAMIGDSTHDLHAARAAGSHGVGVLTGPAKSADLIDSADAVFASIELLPSYLADLRQALG